MDQLERVEFRRQDGEPDLRVSTYLLDHANQAVRACAEHMAAIPLDPPRITRGIDCDDSGRSLQQTPGSSAMFEFIRDAHREIVLANRSELHLFISLLRARDSGRRRCDVSADEIKAYGKALVALQDPEWLVAVGGGVRKWLTDLTL